MSSVSDLYEARVRAGDLTPDPAQRALLPALDRVLADLTATPPAPDKGWRTWFSSAPDPVPMRGLYLWGGVGRGKSMLMDLMVEAAPIAQKRRVHFHAFMQEVQAGLNEARKAGQQDAVRPVAEKIAAATRLFCFDEMQITDIADAMIVGRLFQILFEKGVMIVTTSNREPEELYKHGLNRQLFLPFIALLREKMEVVEIDSIRDHRQDRLTGAQVWFAPIDGESRAAMDAVWAGLTRGDQVAPLTLSVKGREVVLPRHDDRVARVSFWDLCGRPLGPADYLAVAQAVDVLLIDAIPQLGSTNYNEAKRFVTLIDALYEAKVRVIASAAAEPESLYVEGEGSFEFERTASRLREMQDVTWGMKGQDA